MQGKCKYLLLSMMTNALLQEVQSKRRDLRLPQLLVREFQPTVFSCQNFQLNPNNVNYFNNQETDKNLCVTYPIIRVMQWNILAQGSNFNQLF